MSSLTIVWGDPTIEATLEPRRVHDPETGMLHESYLWDCKCGARGQAATIHDAQGDLARHRHATHELPGQVSIEDAIAEASR
jgi:hypothetical protein